MQIQAGGAGDGPGREAAAAPGWGRGVAAGLLAAVTALAAINLAALPGLLRLLPLVVVLPVLICIAGPVIEELCKYGAFRLVARPARRGWRAYWALGLTFGALEAALKLTPLLLGSSDGAPTLPLPGGAGAFHARVAGALTSLLLHGALGGIVAVVATDRGGRGRLALLLAIVLHMGFNTLTTLAVVALDRVAGEPGAALAVWLALLLAIGVALLPFAMPRRVHGVQAAVAPPPPPAVRST